MISLNVLHIFAIILMIHGIVRASVEPSSYSDTKYVFRETEDSKFEPQNDGKCAPQLKRCDEKNIFYTLDGSCNNLEKGRSNYGQAMFPFARILSASFSKEQSKLLSVKKNIRLPVYHSRLSKSGKELPNPRKIATTLLTEEEDDKDEIRNILFVAFGQFSSHDVSELQPLLISRECCLQGRPVNPMPYECYNTVIPKDDSFYSTFNVECVGALRAATTHFLDCDTIDPVRQVNYETSFLDLSLLYSTNEERSRRTREMQDGLLKTDNSADVSGEFPVRSSGGVDCPYGGLNKGLWVDSEEHECFFSGNDRINQNPEIFSMNNIFLRFHNFIARELKKLNSQLNDEQLYLHARRINVAVYQNIFFSEFMELLIGSKAAKEHELLTKESDYSSLYRPDIQPHTFHEYSSTVGRSGHSIIKGIFKYGQNSEKTYVLHKNYHLLNFVRKKNEFKYLIDAYASNNCNKQNEHFSPEVGHLLQYNEHLKYGNDLTAMTINRGREFGVQPYNKYREFCNLNVIKTFEDLRNYIMNPEKNIEKLKSLYEDVGDIDLYVGASLEKFDPDSPLGPTFICLLATQFQRWKFGDRLYFEFPTAGFSTSQLKTIRSIKLAHIICASEPELKEIHEKAFLVGSETNSPVDCKVMVEAINLKPFTQRKSVLRKFTNWMKSLSISNNRSSIKTKHGS